MREGKSYVLDLLFWVQILGAVLFCGAYAIRSFTDVTGSSVAQFGLVALFVLFHLALALGAHRTSPSRLTRQTIVTYLVWFVLMFIVVFVVLTNPTYRWNEKDTTTLLTAGFLTTLVFVVCHLWHTPIQDPMAKALFAIVYKSIPQVLLAWKFLAEGATGTPGLSVIVGHTTIIIRLIQLYFMVKEAGWDQNRKWLAISELSNQLSWVIATIAWLIVS